LKQIRKRLTYANVMSSLAVFLILGGATAFAAVKKVGANEIKANSIKTGKLVKEAVTAGKIKKNAITESRIADGAVTNSKIADNAVSTNKIADNAVSTNKIANGAVTGGKIAGSTVTRANLAEANFIPRGYALVNTNGTTQSKFTSGIPNATNPSSGVFCFDLAFAPVNAQATVETDTEPNDMASVALAGTTGGLEKCPAGNDLEVNTWDTQFNELESETFFLVVW